MFNLVSSLGISFWDVVLAIFSFIPKLMYLITTSLFSILDVFQLLFRKLAGLDTYYVTNSGQTTQQTGDIIEEFINGIFTNKYPILSNIFWSFIILGIVMLFVTTLVAIIRNEYTPEKDGSNSKSKVIGRSIKAFLSFAIVPVVVIFGVYLCNIFLRALDGITSGSSTDALGLPTTNLAMYQRSDNFEGSNSYIAYSLFTKKIATNTTPFSGVAFKAAAYRANRARSSTEFYQLLDSGEITNWDVFTGVDAETAATYLDNAFANNVRFQQARTLDYSTEYQSVNNILSVDIISGADCASLWTEPFDSFDRFRVGLVWYYYDLWQFDFFIVFAILLSMLGVFFGIIFGLMKRFFEIVGLFLVSPAVVALMPLDDGAAFGKWKGKFVSKMLGAYGAVVGMNLMFVIMPYIYQIKFFNIGIVDTIIQAIFIIVGLVTVKGFIALMSEIAGGDDVHKAGADIAKDVGSTVQKAGAATLKTTGAALKIGGITSLGGIGLSAAAAGVRSINLPRRNRAAGAGPAGGAGGPAGGGDTPVGGGPVGGAGGPAGGGPVGGAGGPAGGGPVGGAGGPAGGGPAGGGGTPVGGGPAGGGGTPAGGRRRRTRGPVGYGGRFIRNIGRNALSAFGALRGMGGMLMETVRGTDFYKGWDEAGGGDGIIIYARGGSGSDVKAYKAAKDHYKARNAAAAVEGAGDYLRDANELLIPERNSDGSVRRELIPTEFDREGRPIAFREGNIIYQRGNRNPNVGNWTIR